MPHHLRVVPHESASSFRAQPALGGIGTRGLSLSVLVPVYNERHLVQASLRRLLSLRHELIRSLEVIVVDDGSRDGSWEMVQRVARDDPRVIALQHDQNRGKGSAVQTALERASGDVTIIHDADLEYNPEDIPAILVPFVTEGADAVFGSRYLSAPYRRALMHRHTTLNRFLTAVSSWLTDLNLSDVETCYKAVRTPLLKSIPLRSRDFRLEIELAFKLAKRRATVFEVPIRYLPRSYREGKKIRARDGFLALQAMLRYTVIDDVYKDDEYGSRILAEMERARRFNVWMGDTLRPFVGDRVLELGAGIGTLTSQFIPRDEYVASDVNPHYLDYLRSYSWGKPYLEVVRLDATNPADFAGLEGRFDTVLMINVLEHLTDRRAVLANLYRVLDRGGRAVILVPQHPGLYGSLDDALSHKLRYRAEELRADLESCGFEVERLFDFNRFSVPGWWLNGRVLKRRTFSRLQLKILDTMIPLVRRIDRALPWRGLSLVAVGRRGD